MEAQIGYIENVVKKADAIHKGNKAATTIQSAFRNKKALKEVATKYVDKQQSDMLKTMEDQLGYIENVVKKADDTQKQ